MSVVGRCSVLGCVVAASRSCNASAPQPYDDVLAVGRRPEDKRKGTFVAVWTGSKPPAKSKPLFCVWVCGLYDSSIQLLLLRFRGRREQNRRTAMRPAAVLYGNHTTSRRCRGPRACGATRTTRPGSANHWNPRAGGVSEPRHPHGDTPDRGACQSATVTLRPALHLDEPTTTE